MTLSTTRSGAASDSSFNSPASMALSAPFCKFQPRDWQASNGMPKDTSKPCCPWPPRWTIHEGQRRNALRHFQCATGPHAPTGAARSSQRLPLDRAEAPGPPAHLSDPEIQVQRSNRPSRHGRLSTSRCEFSRPLITLCIAAIFRHTRYIHINITRRARQAQQDLESFRGDGDVDRNLPLNSPASVPGACRSTASAPSANGRCPHKAETKCRDVLELYTEVKSVVMAL